MIRPLKLVLILSTVIICQFSHAQTVDHWETIIQLGDHCKYIKLVTGSGDDDMNLNKKVFLITLSDPVNSIHLSTDKQAITFLQNPTLNSIQLESAYLNKKIFIKLLNS